MPVLYDKQYAQILEAQRASAIQEFRDAVIVLENVSHPTPGQTQWASIFRNILDS